jgi:hypothetical protein
MMLRDYPWSGVEGTGNVGGQVDGRSSMAVLDRDCEL